MRYYELRLAYGRTAKTAKEVKAAWAAGQDFEGDFSLGFKPVNVHDIPNPCTVNLRFNNDRGVTVVKVPAVRS